MNDSNQDQDKILPVRVIDIIAPDEADLPLPVPSLRHPQRGLRTSIVLFIATCLTTFCVGALPGLSSGWIAAIQHGLLYAVPLMTILLCHEMGHFLQSYRYGVFAKWPFFIPVPLRPIGTMGAVIVMEPRAGHRRALFDIGITGPLAGLVPTVIFCIVGIQLSTFVPEPSHVEPGSKINVPLLFEWLYAWFGKPVPAGQIPVLHPVAFAGWVGLLITSLNLIPIGQLDGGHILYALLRKMSRVISTVFLVAALVLVATDETLWAWSLMLILLLIIGPRHPPTANDDEPLGFFRHVLGWLTLAFVVVGFTPRPFIIPKPW